MGRLTTFLILAAFVSIHLHTDTCLSEAAGFRYSQMGPS